ncbi:MAG: PAS domain S-box protein [Desulfobacterales bacterium]|nr:MAG: PAS domain S-box protein [Desulfobacterales bacterium]
MIVTFWPIWTVDIVGSILMIIFSFLCLKIVRSLRRRDPSNVIWTYLLRVCFGLAGFAVSRSAGHILKQILLLSGHGSTWDVIRPFSGAVNSFMFVLVASVTLFFERIWKIYRQVSTDKQALQAAHEELMFLNQNLEELVRERSEALALSEKKYRRIFEVSRDMILVVNKEGLIVDLNPARCQMLGFDGAAGSPQGRDLRSFFCREEEWRGLQNTLDNAGFVLNAEVDLCRLDGTRMRSLLSGSVDDQPSEKERTIHLLVKDIEQRRLMQEQMAQADRLASIGQLSSGIAHEINNPLSIILGYSQLLLRQASPETERHQDLKTIEKHVRHCKSIVEDLLSFARRSEPKKETVNLNQAIDDVLSFIHRNSDNDKIEIRKEYDPQIPPLFLDEKKIKQVLINLIMNARHAVGKTGVIRLSTAFAPSTREVTINVSDDGYGIEAKNLSRIFNPFFTTKPTGEGTGLGLSVSYGIIKKHGGDILVESKPGEGSVFTVVLPVASEHPEISP